MRDGRPRSGFKSTAAPLCRSAVAFRILSFFSPLALIVNASCILRVFPRPILKTSSNWSRTHRLAKSRARSEIRPHLLRAACPPSVCHYAHLHALLYGTVLLPGAVPCVSLRFLPSSESQRLLAVRVGPDSPLPQSVQRAQST